MMKKFTKMMAILVLFTASLTTLWAQPTMPTAFDLSTGSYSFTEWATTNAAGTYPANMIFHKATPGDPTLGEPMTSNYTAAYNLTSGTRIEGLGTGGVRLNNSGSGLNLGAAVVALNTVNRNTVKVSWNSKIISQGDRIYGLRLQYQIGDAGTFKDVTDASGKPVEVLADRYTSAMGLTGANWTFTNIELPQEASNQTKVYLRWKYYYVSGVGSRPSISIDDILVTSENSIGTATKLKIATVNPPTPSANFPFAVTVRSTDDAGIPKFVTTATSISLNVVTGTGTLTGTTTAVIPVGSYEAVLTNLKYNVASDLTLSATDVSTVPTLALDTKTISFVIGPSALLTNGLIHKTHKNFPLPAFTVDAVDQFGVPSVNYHNFDATITAVGPGNMVGTNVKTFYYGTATFNNISFDAPGFYTLIISAPGFSNSIVTNITVADEIAQTELFVPVYIKGGNGTLTSDPYNNRFPSLALVEFKNLLPNTTYRYLTGATNLSTYAYTVPTNNGSGNNIHYNDFSEMYNYNSFRDFASTFEDYSVFTTASDQTSKKVWINFVNTSTVFAAGNTIYWLSAIAFEDGRFIKRFMSTKTSKALEYGNDSASATGIYDADSWLEPKTYLAFFDDTNVEPISTAIVQSIGSPLQSPGFTPQTPQYFADLEGVNSAWAGYLPNNLPSGVKRIAQYDEDGKMLNQWTDADGKWASVNTVNPNGGKLSPINFETPQIELLSPVSFEEICNNDGYFITWNSHGVDKINIEISYNDGVTYQTIFENIPARSGEFYWDIPRHLYSEKYFTLRISSAEHSYINSRSDYNYIWDSPIQVDITASAALCKTESYMLNVVADGSALSYQWFKDNLAIPGATSSYYNLNGVDYLNSGSYQCVVTGRWVCPILYSNVIEIYVATPTAITRQPDVQNVIAGGVARFYAEAHIVGQRPNGNVDIQWYKGRQALVDNDRIAGSRSNLLTINGVVPADESNEYFVVFNGLCPTARVESRKVELKLVDLAFTTEPLSRIACVGSDVEFLAEAATTTGAAITYQWYKGNVPLSDGARISGATTNKLSVTLLEASDAADYRVMASIQSIGLYVWSATATLITETAPVAVTQPEANVVVDDGNTITIEFDAVSTKPITYQWYKDGRPILNSSDRIYTQVDAKASDAGEYYCKATNDCGSITSDKAYVTVTVKGITDVKDEADSFSLLNVSPNPVSTLANIYFNAQTTDNVSITLSDALGNEIANIFNGTANFGENTVSFDAKSLPSGIYFVTLKSINSVSTQRLVVVK